MKKSTKPPLRVNASEHGLPSPLQAPALDGFGEKVHAAEAVETVETKSLQQGIAGDPHMQAYLQHVRFEKRLASRTVTLYTLDLEKLLQLAHQLALPVLALQNAHIRRGVAQMHSAGRSGRGIALILSGWRGYYHWAAQQGLVAHNPVHNVRAPRAPKPLPKALGVDDAVRLANHHSDSARPWLEARDAAIVELLYGCGIRVGELVSLDITPTAEKIHTARGWLDLPSGEAHVIGKGSKRRVVPIGAAAVKAVQEWVAVREQWRSAQPASMASSTASHLPTSAHGDDSALFLSQRGQRLTAQSVWLRVRQRSQQAGLTTPVHPHMLRHSFASHILQSSGDLRAVQELLGHANITTTQVYTRLDFQHLAKVYDATHPRAQRQPESPLKTDRSVK